MSDGNKNKWLEKNLHLLISAVIVFPTGIIYGTPSLISLFFDIQPSTVDFRNMLKTIMCLYLGISVFWIYGMFDYLVWRKATESNAFFMLLLASGRLISIVLDGMPTQAYVWGVLGEVILGTFALFQLKKFK